MTTALPGFLSERLSSSQTTWSIGVFGALAEFHRDPDEPAEASGLQVVTARGAIRLSLNEKCSAVAYTARSAKQQECDFGTALCLPEAAARLKCCDVLTELGSDRDAINERDRSAILFDLGLGSPYGIFCVRTQDEKQIAKLRTGLGRPFLGSALFNEVVGMSPQRVFMSRLGRIEVYQRIAAPGTMTPQGPHTHLLPRLVSRKRAHSACVLLPQGLIACANYYPVGARH